MKRISIPVRVKLTVWYVLLLGLTLGSIAGYLYFRLERKLMSKVDTTLQIATAQSLMYLNQGNILAFQNTPNWLTTAERLSQVGLAVRLITPKGTIVEGFGRYQEVPSWIPVASGYKTLETDGADWRAIAQPVIRADRTIGWLQAAQSLETLEDIAELPREILLNLPLILLFAALGGLFLSNRALRPIEQITQTARAIAASHLNERINYRGAADEVGQLATTFDQMLDRLQAAFEREQRFTADAAHELRTPLTVIKGRIEVARTRLRTSDEYDKTLQQLELEVARLIRLTQGLLLLARIDRGQLPFSSQAVDLNQLLETILEQMQPLAEARQIQLVNQLPREIWVQGDPDHLIGLFLNLLDNAVKYTPDAGVVRLHASKLDNTMEVSVSNTGSGIPPEHLPHLFERFYRTESARCFDRHGAGLGLAIAYEIARLHGGAIAAQSHLGQETILTVTLPISQEK
jgi:heavy metal sensor kinase